MTTHSACSKILLLIIIFISFIHTPSVQAHRTSKNDIYDYKLKIDYSHLRHQKYHQLELELKRRADLSEEEEIAYAVAASKADHWSKKIKDFKNRVTESKMNFDEVESDSFRLPKLSNADIAAGVDDGIKYYDISLQQLRVIPGFKDPHSLFWLLHAKGHVVDESILKEIFLKSVFRYNTRKILGYDLGYNYKMMESPQFRFNSFDIHIVHELCQKLGLPLMTGTESEIKQFSKVETVISSAVSHLQKNPLLVRLGIAFQRQKIVVEKLQDKLRNEEVDSSSGPEKAQRVQKLGVLLYRHDRFAIDLQTVIYHWMKEVYSKLMVRLELSMSEDEDEIETGEFLESEVPVFLSYVYYSNLISILDDLVAPRSSLDGIDLGK